MFSALLYCQFYFGEPDHPLPPPTISPRFRKFFVATVFSRSHWRFLVAVLVQTPLYTVIASWFWSTNKILLQLSAPPPHIIYVFSTVCVGMCDGWLFYQSGYPPKVGVNKFYDNSLSSVLYISSRLPEWVATNKYTPKHRRPKINGKRTVDSEKLGLVLPFLLFTYYIFPHGVSSSGNSGRVVHSFVV